MAAEKHIHFAAGPVIGQHHANPVGMLYGLEVAASFICRQHQIRGSRSATVSEAEPEVACRVDIEVVASGCVPVVIAVVVVEVCKHLVAAHHKECCRVCALIQYRTVVGIFGQAGCAAYDSFPVGSLLSCGHGAVYRLGFHHGDVAYGVVVWREDVDSLYAVVIVVVRRCVVLCRACVAHIQPVSVGAPCEVRRFGHSECLGTELCCCYGGVVAVKAVLGGSCSCRNPY